MKRTWALGIILLLTAVLLTGCMASAEPEKKTGGIKVVATDFPCYDFARAVLGNSRDVTMLIRPGAEVHSYEPTPADVVKILEADLFVYIGGESDAWVDSILGSLGEDAPRTLRMFDVIEPLTEELAEGMEAEEEEEEDGAEYDEHVWTDPRNAAFMVEALRDALTEIDPAGEADYAARAEDYVSRIEKVDSEIEDIVNSAARREVVFGDRFPFLYLARRYGLQYYAAFPGCAAETEPSAQTVLFLMDRIRQDGVKAVYTIEMSSGLIARTLAEETGAEILTLHSMQNVTLDEFAEGQTYVTLMEKNARALEEGLN